MSGKKFRLPPLSPLIGTGMVNFLRLSAGRKIARKFLLKYILTFLIIIIFTPLRWYESWYLRNRGKVRIQKPVFILGHWRSGTTLLHNLLCQSPGAAYITTYQTVFTRYLGSAQLLKPFMNLLMPSKRPSDNVRLNVDFPQEEEFALCNLTLTSYYHFFYYPESADEFFNSSVQIQDNKSGAWKKTYDDLLRRAMLTMPEKKYLVIKNPVNTGRVNFLRELYPDAYFLHIYRNPYLVFLSTKKFFLELMPTLWFHEMSTSDIEELILEKYIAFMKKFDEERDERIIDIRFEEFERNPVEILKAVYEKLDMEDFESVRPHLEAYAESQKKYRKNTYSISRREEQLVRNRWSEYLRRWNYELPENVALID